jgi:hypothetical protein
MAQKLMAGYKVYDNDEEKLKVYNHRMTMAEEDWQELAPEVEKWAKRYRNKGWENTEETPQGHMIRSGTGRSIIDSLYGMLTNVNIDLNLVQIGAGTPDQAELAQEAMHVEWRKTDVERKGRKGIKSGLLNGIGFAKVYYEFEEYEEEVPRDPEQVYGEMRQIMTGAAKNGLPQPSHDQLAELVPATEVETNVEKDRLCVDYVPISEVRWDPTARDWWDVRWVAQVTLVHPDEIQNNPDYEEYVKGDSVASKAFREIKSQTQAVTGRVLDSRATNIDGEPFSDDGRVKLVEFWDFETGTVSHFILGEEWLLQEYPNQLAFMPDIYNRNPFVAYIPTEDPSAVRGVSEMECMWTTLDEINQYRSDLANHTDRLIPKIYAPEGTFDKAGKAALQSREWAAVAEMKKGHVAAEVGSIQPPAVPSELYNLPDRLERGLRDETGVTEAMRGLFTGGRKTATEAQEVAAGGLSRQAERRNATENYWIDIAQRMLWLMQINYDHDQMVRLTDWEGDVEWEWTNEDIAIEAFIEVGLTPKEDLTYQSRSERVMALANFIGPLPETDRVELARKFGTELGFTVKEMRALVKTPQEVQQEQQAQQDHEMNVAAAAGSPPPPGAGGGVVPAFSGADINAGADMGIPSEVAGGGVPVGEDAIAEAPAVF